MDSPSVQQIQRRRTAFEQAAGFIASTNPLLLEDASNFLLEDGTFLLLEN
jgi:hypothetical protein